MDDHAQHILIVDDSRSDLVLLEGILQARGRLVVTASSGQEALERFPENDFAVVLLDLHLPDMDGFELARRIRQTEGGGTVPIIFVTGSMQEEDEVFRGYDLGAVDYLFKPVEPAHLESKVNVFCQLNAQRKLIERQLKVIEAKSRELSNRLEEIKVLRGLIPICASCKKVRDDTGLWEGIETYMKSAGAAEFTHSLCPDCARTHYPELDHSQES